MKQIVVRIPPIPVAKVVGTFYFLVGLAVLPLLEEAPSMQQEGPWLSVTLLVFVPLTLGLVHAVIGAVTCILYNLLVPRVGGIEFETAERQPSSRVTW